MNAASAFDLQRIFLGDSPPIFLLEIAFRTFVMYLFALLIIRFLGKRGVSEMTPFEYILIIAMGSAAGDPMLYPEVPLLYGFVVLTMIVILQKSIVHLTNNSDFLRQFLESNSTKLIESGKMINNNMKKANISKEELNMKLRERGIEYVSKVKNAYLEPSGNISVFTKKEILHGRSTHPESK